MLASAAVFAAGAAARAQSDAPSNAPPPAPEPAPPLINTGEQGPVVIGEKRPLWKAFQLQRFGAGIEFYTQAQTDTIDFKPGGKIVDRENTYRETFDVDFESYIGHKNFIDLTGVFKLGLEDRYYDYESASDRNHEGDLYDTYDISALILGASRLPTTVYTRRDETKLDRAFASSLTDVITETGIITNVVSSWAPTTLRYFHNEDDQTDDVGLTEYHRKQDTFAFNSNITLDEHNNAEIVYSFDSVDQSQSNGFSNPYDRHDLLATETFTFGGPKRHQLRSFFRYYEQTGLPDQQIVRWDEQLLLNHSQDLQTRYNTTIERQVIDGVEQWLLQGNANVRHQLFESLVSTASVGGQAFSQPGSFRAQQWNVQGGLEYTKKVPMGRLDASVGAGFTDQHNGDRGSDLTIIDERHVFNDPFPVTLARRNVLPGSITVTSETGFPTYTEGLDYTVAYFSDRAELTRVVGGNIADGQTVLVDYTLGPEPSNDIQSTVTSVSVRYTFTEGALDGLAFYTTYRTQYFNIYADDPSQFVLDNVKELLYGTEYRHNSLLLRLEQVIHDSTVNAYDNTRMEAIWDYRIGPQSLFGIDLSRELINYDDPPNDVVLDRVTARWNQQLSRQLDFELRLIYRNETNELEGNSRGFDQSLAIHWHKGQTSLYANIRNEFLFSDPQDNTTQTLEFGLRRNF